MTMKHIPKTKNTLLLRTDFSDETLWERLCTVLQEPFGEFQAYVTPVSDAAFERASVDEVGELAREASHSFVFIADREALANPEHPVLVLDVAQEPGRTFRVIPRQAWAVENNLSLANMDFEEFADAADTDGVFRGFDES
jgi:hypothetical protein